ncbi:acyltransferase [Pseudomonas poae]|uniref:Acyltransferase n=1 Tax=Pseudomonas poae TaxID=200451 RepID=A0A7M1KMD0_9PSED|nr:acyltransferase [Pseudomonas poae]QOQ77447.1 acyltransferase [Pseudomonas poae]
MKSSDSLYLSKLDHLRFLAALLVLAWHIMRHQLQVPTTFIPSFWPMSLFAEGHTGVALFMVLSGYIFMTLCHDREIDYFAFIRNRMLRIAPLFILWTLLYFYIGNIDPAKLIVAVGALLDHKTVPGVGWTVIVEFQFYLLFPFLLIFSRKMGLRYLVGLILLAVAIRWCIWFTLGTVQDLAYSTIFGRIDQFLLGMLACAALRKFPTYFKSPLVLLALVALWSFLYHRFDVLGGYFDNHGFPSQASVWVYLPTLEGLFYGLITAAYLGTVQLLPRVLDKAIAWLGMLSYSLYLNHPWAIEVAMKILKRFNVDMTDFWTALILGMATVLPILIVMSAGTYYLIEKPFLSLRTRYLKPVVAQPTEHTSPVSQQLPA